MHARVLSRKEKKVSEGNLTSQQSKSGPSPWVFTSFFLFMGLWRIPKQTHKDGSPRRPICDRFIHLFIQQQQSTTSLKRDDQRGVWEACPLPSFHFHTPFVSFRSFVQMVYQGSREKDSETGDGYHTSRFAKKCSSRLFFLWWAVPLRWVSIHSSVFGVWVGEQSGPSTLCEGEGRMEDFANDRQTR